MKNLSKIWWGFIILLVLVAGIVAWLVWDGYVVPNYNDVNDGARLTDEEITEHAKAVKLVEQLPEVAAWLKQFSGPKGTSPETGARGFVETQSRLGNDYSVHAYEEPGLYLHFPVKTFGWYEVNRTTWEVKRGK